MTYIELVNKVLIKLREVEVSSVSESTYSKLIGEFVNEAKEEVENSWDWSILRTEQESITSIGSWHVDTPFVKQRDTIHSVRVRYEDIELRKVPAADIKEKLYSTSPASGIPSEYSFHGITSGETALSRIWLYPVPDEEYTISVWVTYRQATLTEDSDVLRINERAVILGAYYRAVKERGEDSGDGSSQAAADYAKAWTDAVALDASNQHEVETSWQVV